MDAANLSLSVNSRTVSQATEDLNRFSGAGARAEAAARGVQERARDTGASMRSLGSATAALDGPLGGIASRFRSLGTLITQVGFAAAALTLALGAAIVAITRYGAGFADTWSDINARVGLAVGNMDASGDVLDRLSQVARRTYSSLELTAEGFIRNATVLRELGKSTRQQLDYTESLNLALVVSGARADRAASLQESLGRAMAIGALRGNDLNNVIQNGGRVAEVLAEELGVGVNQLRQLGAQGKITGDLIYNALTRRMEQLRKEAELMPATIGDAFMILRNAFLQLVGVYDQSNQLSATFAEAVIALADSLGVLAKALAIVAVGLTTAFSATILAGVKALTVAIGVGLVGAFRMLTIAMLANPLTSLATLLSIAISSAYLFRDEISRAEGPLRMFGDMLDWVVDKLYLIGDAYTALTLKFKAASINDDAMQAVALSIAKLNDDLREFESARDSALGQGGDAAAFEAAISSIQNQIEEATAEYWRMAEVRKYAEMSFTEIVAQEAAKRRELWSWERGTVVTRADAPPGTPLPTTVDTSAYDKRTKAIQRQIEAMKIEAATYGMATREAERYRTQKELEYAVVEAGLKLTPKMRVEILALADAYGLAAESTERAREAQQRYDDVRNTFQSSFSSFVVDIKNGESALQSLASILDRIADRLLDMASNDLFELAFGKSGTSGSGILGSLFGPKAGPGGWVTTTTAAGSGGLLGGMLIPGILHQGGVAGNDNVPTRPVPASIFADAHRYHGGGIAGLRRNEVPAILERGEEVLTRRDPRHRNNGGDQPVMVQPKVVVNNYGNDEVSTGMNERGELEVTIRAIARDELGSRRGGNIMQQGYGVAPRVKMRG